MNVHPNPSPVMLSTPPSVKTKTTTAPTLTSSAGYNTSYGNPANHPNPAFPSPAKEENNQENNQPPKPKSSTSTLSTTSRRSSRLSRRLSSFRKATRATCIHHIIRCLLALPTPCFLTFVLLLPVAKRTTIGVDFIRSSTQIAQLMLYSISQGIVAWRLGQPESWGITKVAEFLVVYGCALAGGLIVFASRREHGNYNIVSLLNQLFFYVGVAAILPFVIKQGMVFQKEAFSGYIYGVIKMGGVACAIIVACIACAGGAFSAHDIDFQNLDYFDKLSNAKNFSCRTYEEFVESTGWINSTSMSHVSELHCKMESVYCGYETWEDACWTIQLTKVAWALHNDLMQIALQSVGIVAASSYFTGRGLFRMTPQGGVDSDSLVFFSNPPTLWFFFALLCSSIITLFNVGRYSINASLMVLPRPAQLTKINLKPGICYTLSCVENLYVYSSISPLCFTINYY